MLLPWARITHQAHGNSSKLPYPLTPLRAAEATK